jgi:hypothetical protein
MTTIRKLVIGRVSSSGFAVAVVSRTGKFQAAGQALSTNLEGPISQCTNRKLVNSS